MKAIVLHTVEAYAELTDKFYATEKHWYKTEKNKDILQEIAKNIEIEVEKSHGSWGVYNINGKKLPLQYVHHEGSNYVGLRSFEKEGYQDSLSLDEWVSWEYAQRIFRDYMEYERLK